METTPLLEMARAAPGRTQWPSSITLRILLILRLELGHCVRPGGRLVLQNEDLRLNALFDVNGHEIDEVFVS